MDQSLQKVYICTGTCQAQVPEDQYAAGATTCNTQGCSMYGQPLVEKEPSPTPPPPPSMPPAGAPPQTPTQ